jgi:dTDP-glucose pyrophosphorylase/CBS domain-containing protein
MIPLEGPLKEAVLVGLDAHLRDVLLAMERGGYGITLFVDHGQRFIGLVTDHDIRKAFLQGVSLTDRVEPYINRSPVVARVEQPREEIFELIRRTERSPVPLLDSNGRVVGLEALSFFFKSSGLSDHVAVVMAGGLGTRLHPLTLDRPKPMLPVQGKPLLQIILENLRTYGFRRVYIAVYFQRKTIEEYFWDGRAFGLQIEYLREKQPLGTAGALALLPERPARPFVVMNGDLLTRVNMESLMTYHVRADAQFTMCVRPYELQIPFGVVRVEGSQVVALEEKPVHGCFVNAGIYVLDPGVLDLVQGSEPLDMTDLIGTALKRWGSINSFPIHEYWLDVGQHDDYERARRDY